MKRLINALRNRTAAFSHDLLMVPVAWLGSYWLRFNLEPVPEPFLGRALALLPLVVAIHALSFVYFGLYRGVWRFASMPDFMRITKAVLTAALTTWVLVFVFTQMQYVPRSVPLAHGLILLVLLGMPRFVYRWVKDHRLYFTQGSRVLIVGAGRAGETLTRELLADPGGDYLPVAFVDDDPRKRGKEIRGVRVMGDCADIPEIVARYNIDLVFIAVPTASARTMRRIVGLCEAGGRPIRTLPSFQDLLSGRAILQELRELSIEDLLGREPVSLDWSTIRRELEGRTVLVSGGGGSIGSELCRQVAALGPAALVLLDQSEFNLYSIDTELRERYPGLNLHSHLGDVRDTTAVDRLLAAHRPEVIFHAAAYKHVPLLEPQVREAVRNNVLGTVNLAEAACRNACKVFVLISTDKAVHPTNVMGASKRLSEIYCQNFNRYRGASTRFVTVRFGNVLGSAGSVVPRFRRQIEHGGPVTVTHPEVSRYFMTIREACQLILQAGAAGAGGEIFVLDMGQPIRITYLAQQMILLSGRTPGEDIEIVYTGLRPGEKLHEELFYDDEQILPTRFPKLQLARQRSVDWPAFMSRLGALRRACDAHDDVAIALLLADMVPEFQPDSSVTLEMPHRAARA